MNVSLNHSGLRISGWTAKNRMVGMIDLRKASMPLTRSVCPHVIWLASVSFICAMVAGMVHSFYLKAGRRSV